MRFTFSEGQTQVSRPNIAKKTLKQLAEINLFLSASGGKVKYFIGALSYGTKIQRGPYIKISYGYLYVTSPLCLI